MFPKHFVFLVNFIDIFQMNILKYITQVQYTHRRTQTFISAVPTILLSMGVCRKYFRRGFWSRFIIVL
jgi:hypothetical protein